VMLQKCLYHNESQTRAWDSDSRVWLEKPVKSGTCT
jgi:hypothetical protein